MYSMAEPRSGFETTPLLFDSLSPPSSNTTTSSLSLSRSHAASYPGGTRRRGAVGRGGVGRSTYSGRRFQRMAQVHPNILLHEKSLIPWSSRGYPPSSSTSAANFSYTSSTPSSSHQALSSSTTNRLSLTPNKLWQTIISIPHHMLCFTSPICSPCCGLCCCVTCVRTSEYGVMQRFGKFEKILHPGMHFMKWPVQREAGRISMRIRQLDVNCETKSKDHVFLRVHVSIQYQTNSTHLFESFYSLASPTRQLSTHVHSVIRSTLPTLDLDDIFSSQDYIAKELYETLNDNMNEYGYVIHHALITKIWPNDHVKEAMNEIEASKRIKEAAPQKGEAIWIEAVKGAEARAERAHLNGVGVARERREIARGMKNIVESVVGSGNDGRRESTTTISTKGVMDLLLLTQYFDVLTDLNGPRGRKGDDDSEDESAAAPSSMFLTHHVETVTQLAEVARECFGDANCSSVEVENLLDL